MNKIYTVIFYGNKKCKGECIKETKNFIYVKLIESFNILKISKTKSRRAWFIDSLGIYETVKYITYIYE